MLDTFIISLRLRIAYRINSFIYALKHLPLIKKAIPASAYGAGWLKSVALAYSVLVEILTFFLGKLLYLLVLCAAVSGFAGLVHEEENIFSFPHILLFLSFFGFLVNNHMFEARKDKYYAISLMRMDARKCTLSGYIYYLFKTGVGFFGSLLLFYFLLPNMGLTLLHVFTFPLFIVGGKLTFAAVNLKLFERKQKLFNANFYKAVFPLLLLLLVILAYLPVFLNFYLPPVAVYPVQLFFFLTGIAAVPVILRSKEYRSIYLLFFSDSMNLASGDTSTVTAGVQKTYQSKLTYSEQQDSRKKGCAYMHELFMKRHRRMLLKPALITTAILTAIFIAFFVVLYFISDEGRQEINKNIINILPWFLFVMYFINRGQTISQILFFNCDYSLLTYRFYKRPKAILSLFRERLKSIILINLIPSSVIAAGLPLILLCTGGTDQPLNYLAIVLSIISMSVFFSVHYLVIYYLLQPFNIALESKSIAYNVICGVTYVVCYSGTKIQAPAMIFGLVITLFAVIYIVVALILAYRLAPRTFRIHM